MERESPQLYSNFGRFWSKIVYGVKGLIWTVVLLVVFLIMIVFALLVSIFKPSEKANVNYYSGRLLAAIMSPILGIRWKIINESISDTAGRPCVFVANHQSSLDILCMGKVCPQRTVVMAKKQIKFLPFIGQYFLLAANFLVDRKNHERAMKTMSAICDEMKKKGLALWIFPEGTRSHSRNPELLPFKKGAFRLAIDNQWPIVPVLFSQYTPVYERGKAFYGGTIVVKFLDPISTEGMTADDTQALLDKTHDVMNRELKRISFVPGKTYVWGTGEGLEKKAKELELQDLQEVVGKKSD